MNKEQIKERLCQLDVLIDLIWDESMNHEDGWNWYKNHPYLKEYHKLSQEYKLLMDESDYELHDIPDYGDKMTLEDFIECCEVGGFVDSDGFGCYATKTKESSIEIHPSDITEGRYRKDFSHIVWYNK